MADQDRFRFDLRDEEPEVAFQDEELSRRVKRLSRRLSFLTLLLPCLLAIALYVGYRDLVLRTHQTQSTELQSVEKVAAEIDQKIAFLNTRLADYEAAWTARLDAAQKSVQALQEELRKSETGVADKLGAAKADKKDLADATARTDAALAAVNKDLQAVARELQALAPFREELGSAAALRGDVNTLSGRLQKLENSLGKDLTGLAGYMDRTKTDFEKIRTDLANLQTRKLDRESLDLEVLKAKRIYQMTLDQEIARIEKTLNTLQRRLDQVEKAFGARSTTPPSLPPLSGGIKEQPVE
jgi:DNA repair exonuclease SbcCD ATPase subunit